LAYFAFILALFLASQLFMLVISIQFDLFAFILALFLASQSSMLVTSIQFGLFCIYPFLIFS